LLNKIDNALAYYALTFSYGMKTQKFILVWKRGGAARKEETVIKENGDFIRYEIAVW
jgi:hypothetical protein